MQDALERHVQEGSAVFVLLAANDRNAMLDSSSSQIHRGKTTSELAYLRKFVLYRAPRLRESRVSLDRIKHIVEQLSPEVGIPQNNVILFEKNDIEGTKTFFRARTDSNDDSEEGRWEHPCKLPRVAGW